MMTAGPKASRKRFDEGMLLGKQVHVLLDLTWAGQTFHLARTDLLVRSTETGEEIAYEGTLESDVEFEEMINLFSSSGDVASLPVQAVLPVDVPALISQGYDLLQATGVMSLWIEGTTYEDRRIILQGRLTDPEYGWEGEPINASLQSQFFEDRAIIPAPELVITAEAWPTLPAGSDKVGRAYPIVFGLDGDNAVTHSECYLVDDTAAAEVVLVAGHVCETGSVRLTTASGGGPTTFPLSTVQDALGRTCTVVAANLGGGFYTADDTFFCIFDQGTGGALTHSGSEALTGAGDVLEYFLVRSTVRCDLGRIAAAKPYLNRFKLAGCVLEGVSPYEYVTANLSPILPMSVVDGPHGTYVVPWRYDATLKDVVERLDLTIDPTIEQEGPVAYTAGIKDLVNSFRLKYNLSQRLGDMQSHVLLSGSRDTSNIYSAESITCRQSELRYGRRDLEEESTIVRDSATAGLIVAWWARAKSLPARTVSYSVGYERAWLERGDVVSITDPNLHLTDQVALIEGIVYREDATLLLTLRIIEDVATTFHGSGS